MPTDSTPSRAAEVATPITDAVAKRIGSLAPSYKFGDIGAGEFAAYADNALNPLRQLEAGNAQLSREVAELREALKWSVKELERGPLSKHHPQCDAEGGIGSAGCVCVDEIAPLRALLSGQPTPAKEGDRDGRPGLIPIWTQEVGHELASLLRTYVETPEDERGELPTGKDFAYRITRRYNKHLESRASTPANSAPTEDRLTRALEDADEIGGRS